MGDERNTDDGFEGDVSDKAGDRLGGGAAKEPEVEVGPQDQPAPLLPEP